MAIADDEEFEGHALDGMARAFWVHAYMIWATEVEPPPMMSGQTWEEVAPDTRGTRSASMKAAEDFVRVLAKQNNLGRHGLGEVFIRAVKEQRGRPPGASGSKQPGQSGRDAATEGDLAYAWGEDLAHVCMGTRDADDALIPLPRDLIVPSIHVELNDDGQEMFWDIRTDAGGASKNPCSCKSNPASLDVLLIEDDKALQKATTRMIKKLYPPAEVLIADNYLSAIGVLETHNVKLVVSDVDILGERTGIDVFEWVKEHQPHLIDKYVFFTGGNPQVEQMHYRYLEKPATVEDLRQAIWKAPPGAAPAVARTRSTTKTPSALVAAVATPAGKELTTQQVAQRVRDALPHIAGPGRFGPDKVFIIAVWRYLAATDPQIQAMGLPAFKRALIAAQRDEGLILAREDLGTKTAEVADSEILDMGSTFHFVLDRARKNPASAPEFSWITLTPEMGTALVRARGKLHEIMSDEAARRATKRINDALASGRLRDDDHYLLELGDEDQFDDPLTAFRAAATKNPAHPTLIWTVVLTAPDGSMYTREEEGVSLENALESAKVRYGNLGWKIKPGRDHSGGPLVRCVTR